MKKKKKQLSLSKLLLVGFIILIPVIIAVFASYMHSVKPHGSHRAGTYVYKDNSVVKYYQKGVKKLNNLVKNRPSLIPADETVKEKLIKKKNPLANTQDYTITYDPETDMFQAQINTTTIDVAKKEVINWFVNQGMSSDAVCKLPVSFTLKPSIAKDLQGLDILFNPLAPGC